MNNSSSSGFISLQKAIEMTTRYRQNKEAVIDPRYAGANILSICDTFNKTAVATLLAKPDCTAIRLYYGMDEALQIRPILVAVNEKDEDILPDLSTLESEEPGEDIVDDTIKCPPICPPPSVLNQ
ncbi:hypothetical protein ESA94_18165 [Lacibacter luteus]|uniref:Uncharacterized protein n=1 Tax=Lacibacter luteus TaxID=2508719 RepID=A0A4Q1CFY4_9BACT|nr:hypothetical protein [Lacibacter luteus]RXK58557.1 hypothetical protein ESA94_18165 [Lacibacter luteus]